MTDNNQETNNEPTNTEALQAWSDLTQEQKIDLLLEGVGDLEKELMELKNEFRNHQHLGGYSVVVNKE